MKSLIWAFLVVGILLTPRLVMAQQNGNQPYHAEAGPYQIEVLANPSSLSLGTVQYVITVLNSQSNQPVADARVLVRARQLEGEDGWATALNTPAAPARYTAQVELGRPGTWEMSVDVSSPLGRVEIGVPSQRVPEPRQTRAGSLVFMGVFVVLIAGGGYLTWTIRRAQQKREAADAS
jgi:hypothetical protein